MEFAAGLVVSAAVSSFTVLGFCEAGAVIPVALVAGRSPIWSALAAAVALVEGVEAAVFGALDAVVGEPVVDDGHGYVTGSGVAEKFARFIVIGFGS